MENKNEEVETMIGPHDQGNLWGSMAPQSSRGPKRELLSSIRSFIGTGLLGFWFGDGAALGARMVNSLKNL